MLDRFFSAPTRLVNGYLPREEKPAVAPVAPVIDIPSFMKKPATPMQVNHKRTDNQERTFQWWLNQAMTKGGDNA